MAKMKTKELTGRALDYAVALAEGLEPYVYTEGVLTWLASKALPAKAYGIVPNYLDDIDGDDIVDREMISTYPMPGAVGGAWRAEIWGKYLSAGPTRRIAAMRAFVASKLGDEVEIPKELV